MWVQLLSLSLEFFFGWSEIALLCLELCKPQKFLIEAKKISSLECYVINKALKCYYLSDYWLVVLCFKVKYSNVA